ncbi:MAG: peptide-methionine (R)-S-oxide reductase MsrB [Planctomycetes bacterium]|nr:peptide-methionine (R)-S-oxide reductase MsrB [Planctomycetota bacterium]
MAHERIEKTEEEWRAHIGHEQDFQICRMGGTEVRNTGRYVNEKAPGVYACRCCDLPLFRSEAKYDSGSGWPSFFEGIDGEAIAELKDSAHGMVRTEVRCARCDCHLGHVFPDGPQPTGMRYCINSASLSHKGESSD